MSSQKTREVESSRNPLPSSPQLLAWRRWPRTLEGYQILQFSCFLSGFYMGISLCVHLHLLEPSLYGSVLLWAFKNMLDQGWQQILLLTHWRVRNCLVWGSMLTVSPTRVAPPQLSKANNPSFSLLGLCRTSHSPYQANLLSVLVGGHVGGVNEEPCMLRQNVRVQRSEVRDQRTTLDVSPHISSFLRQSLYWFSATCDSLAGPGAFGISVSGFLFFLANPGLACLWKFEAKQELGLQALTLCAASLWFLGSELRDWVPPRPME